MSKNANHEAPTPVKDTDKRDLEGAFKGFLQSLEAIASVAQEWFEAKTISYWPTPTGSP